MSDDSRRNPVPHPEEEGGQQVPAPAGMGAGRQVGEVGGHQEEPAPYYGPYGRQEENWKRYAEVLRRRKWVLLAIVAMGTAAGAAAASLIEPAYTAEVRVWVDQQTEGAGESGPIEGQNVFRSYDWVDLLRSYAVLEPVVQEQGMVARPARSRDRDLFDDFVVEDRYTPGEYRLAVDEDGTGYRLTRDTVLVESGDLPGPVGLEAGFRWNLPADRTSPGSSVEFRLAPSRQVARGLQERLDIRMLERGNFMHIQLQDSDPERAAVLLNAISDRFVSLATQVRTARTDELERRLAEQLDTAAERLTSAEAELQDFRTQTIALPAEGTGSELSPTQAAYFERLYERDRVARDRRALQEILNGADDSEMLPLLLETVPVVAQSPRMRGALEELAMKRIELSTLQREYTDEHAQVQTLRNEIRALEENAIPSMAERLLEALAREEAELTEDIEEHSAELAAIPARATEEARLRRSAAIAGELYTTLRERHDAARLAAASTVPEIQVLDRAEPVGEPEQDLTARFLLFAIVTSLGLGVMGVLLHDRLDPRIRYPDELSREMGLTILGTVPHLKLKRKRSRDDVAEEATEAFRSLRLNLTYAFGSAGPLVATVTSPAPGEGKSFVALNLALRFAKSGARTLLIDGDARRGRLHHTLEIPRRPGLMDHLVGEISAEEIVQETRFDHLSVIASGVRRKNAPELLASPPLADLLGWAKKRFEVILVDTPPLGVGVDPIIFGSLTGNLLLVVRAGATVRGFTEAKLEQLHRLPLRVLGAVMNDVPAGAAYPYYYTYFREYETRDEAAARLLEA